MEQVVLGYSVSVLGLAFAAALCLTAGWTGAWHHVGAQIAALRGPLGLGALVWAAVGLAVGAWVAAVCSLVVGLVTFVPSAPIGIRRSVHGSDDSVSLVTANVLVSNERFVPLVRGLLASGPDIVLIQELTPAHAALMSVLVGARRDLHVEMEARDDFSGWATLSRHPVSARGRIDVPGWPISWVVIELPTGPVRVVNVHAAAPQSAADVTTWTQQFDELARFAGDPIPTVLAGDFNATSDHRAFRRLLDAGFVDAHDVAGRGWGATWPAHRLVPTLLRLDHVLVDERVAVCGLDVIDLPGSDHRGLWACIRRADADGPTTHDSVESAAVLPTGGAGAKRS